MHAELKVGPACCGRQTSRLRNSSKPFDGGTQVHDQGDPPRHGPLHGQLAESRSAAHAYVGNSDQSPPEVRCYDDSMINGFTCPAVESDPGRVSGAWVFRGTRVPVAALFENLEDGASVHDFIEWFQGVTLEQVRTVLEHAAKSALAPA
jgi:uncharacterized protein (DUF433 family)